MRSLRAFVKESWYFVNEKTLAEGQTFFTKETYKTVPEVDQHRYEKPGESEAAQRSMKPHETCLL